MGQAEARSWNTIWLLAARCFKLSSVALQGYMYSGNWNLKWTRDFNILIWAASVVPAVTSQLHLTCSSVMNFCSEYLPLAQYNLKMCCSSWCFWWIMLVPFHVYRSEIIEMAYKVIAIYSSFFFIWFLGKVTVCLIIQVGINRIKYYLLITPRACGVITSWFTWALRWGSKVDKIIHLVDLKLLLFSLAPYPIGHV